MALYSSRCSLCGYEFDIDAPMHEYATISKGKMKYKCPKCGKDMHPIRVLKGTPVIFKGTGFYLTDNRKKEDVNSS